MNRLVRLELRRYRGLVPILVGTAGASMLGAFLLFALIGGFDDSPGNEPLRSYAFVASLGSTVGLCVMTIVGAVLYARNVLPDYVGDRRTLVYLYPSGRRPLYLAKNVAFALVLGLCSLGGFALAVGVFFASQLVAPLLDAAGLQSQWWPAIGISGASSLALALGAALIAGVIGVARRSGVAAVVAAVVIVAVVANGVVSPLQGSPWLSLLLALVTLTVAGGLVGVQGRRIALDEVL